MAPIAVAERHAVPRLRSRKAIWALVLSILGFVLGMAGLWILTTPIVLVLAIWALVDIRRGRVIKGNRMAWFAIALAIIGPLFWFWALLQLYSGLGGGIGLD